MTPIAHILSPVSTNSDILFNISNLFSYLEKTYHHHPALFLAYGSGTGDIVSFVVSTNAARTQEH